MKNTRWAVAGLMILLAVSCTDQAKVYEQEIGTVFEKWTAVFNQHTDKLLKETDPDKTAQVILQCAKDFKELYREVGAVENKFTQLNSDQKGKAIENLKDINNMIVFRRWANWGMLWAKRNHGCRTIWKGWRRSQRLSTVS